MGRISQESAHNTSVKIVEPIKKKIGEVDKEIKELLTEYYQGIIPQEVMKFWKKNSQYMFTVTSIYPKGVGISNSNSEPINNSPGVSQYAREDLLLTKEQAVEFNKLIDKRDDLKQKYKAMQKEIEIAILSLGTYKRVVDQFPEVAEFFPESTKQKMQLTVQLAFVREKVKCMVGTTEEKKCMDKIIG